MNLLIDLSIAVTICFGAIAWGTALLAFAFRRPRLVAPEGCDVLIIAAHQDDCVIMAGEYAISSAKSSRNIHLAYLTCGDALCDSVRSKTRKAEAIHAWSIIGVPPEQIHFFGLPAAPSIEGPLLITPSEVECAKRHLQELIEQLPGPSTIFIPADGEAHVDHQLLREICLSVLSEQHTTEHVVYEASEYNRYYSLFHGPTRALADVMRCIPLVRRIGRFDAKTERAHFPSGPPSLTLRPDSQRLNTKLEMLRAFRSEDSELLVTLFGFPDRFRKVDYRRGANLRGTKTYVLIDGRYLDASVLALWVSILGCLFLTVLAGACQSRHFMPSLLSVSINCCLAVVFVVSASRKVRRTERRAIEIVIGAGLAAAQCC
jgi:LmbE family N-acetylglucosaminyl deacetylase